MQTATELTLFLPDSGISLAMHEQVLFLVICPTGFAHPHAVINSRFLPSGYLGWCDPDCFV